MNPNDLKTISKRHQVKSKTFKHCIIAFVFGGLLSVLAQLVHDFLLGMFSEVNSLILTTLLFILVASLLTGIGIYDKVAKVAGAGLFVPITGFSNALTSSAMECKREGMIYGIGSNMFKLAGSVITYGIVSAILFAFINYGLKLI